MVLQGKYSKPHLRYNLSQPRQGLEWRRLVSNFIMKGGKRDDT